MFCKLLTKITIGLLLSGSVAIAMDFQTLPLRDLGPRIMERAVAIENEIQENESWMPRHFYFTQGLTAAFDIPGIVEIKLVPQVTFVWEADSIASESKPRISP